MIFRPNINPLDKKRFAKYFGMPFSSPSLPESIRNAFYMYYIPEEKETYTINARKEAAFFVLTLFCATDKKEMSGDKAFEDCLRQMMNTSKTDEMKIQSIFRANVNSTFELIATIGSVCRKTDNATYLRSVNLNWLFNDILAFNDVYKQPAVKQKWAQKIFKIDFEEGE